LKRLLGSVLLAGITLGGIVLLLCHILGDSQRFRFSLHCDVPLPEALTGAGATVLVAWWFLLRRQPLIHADLSTPSPGQRGLAILAYTAGAMLATGFLIDLFVSRACLSHDLCTPSEQTASIIGALLFLTAEVFVLIFGWRGRLPGLRRRPAPTTIDHRQ